MVQNSLDELITLSDELSDLLGKPTATPRPPIPISDVPPELATVLTCGALALTLQGVDGSRIAEFTKDARGRGLRRKARVFGWHPMGHTWFATPENHTGEARVLILNRLDRLSATELTVDDYVALCIDEVRTAIAKAKAPKEEPAPVEKSADPETDTETEPEAAPVKVKGRRPPIRVILPESDGATIVAGERTEELNGPDLAYIIWCMTGLQQLEEGTAPILSRWETRCIRSCHIAQVPAADDADRARYDETWNRLTTPDRSARASVSHLIPIWKLTAPGSWILASSELDILRRAVKSIPPRHLPSPEQAAIWARWMSLVEADSVEIHVR